MFEKKGTKLSVVCLALIFSHYVLKYFKFTNFSTNKFPKIAMKENLYEDTETFSGLEGVLSEENDLEINIGFRNLPLLQYDIQYSEMTSANPTPHPILSQDTDFIVQYKSNEAVLYRDHGPGCLFKIFILPLLEREYNIEMRIDGYIYTFYSMDIKKGVFPFLFPLSKTIREYQSGLGTYVPICYKDFAEIVYYGQFEKRKLIKHSYCTLHSKPCKSNIYTGFSKIKFPPGTHIKTFEKLSESRLHKIAEVFTTPEKHAPINGAHCGLRCVNITQMTKTIYEKYSAGLIRVMRFRINPFKGSNNNDWSKLLISITFDDSPEPQVKKIPMGLLFGGMFSHNDNMGVLLGKRYMYCENDERKETTAYIYFPMPFWKSVKITIDSVIKEPISLCYEIAEEKNPFHEGDSGYFNIHGIYFDHNNEGYRELLHCNNCQGHIVGVIVHLNSRIQKKHKPLNEADYQLYIDGALSPSACSTGLEDWFAYAHTWRFGDAPNSSFSFIGAPYVTVSKSNMLSSVHSYRLHVLDPIPFHLSVRFIVEGNQTKNYSAILPITYGHYLRRLKKREYTQAHLMLFYATRQKYSVITDTIVMGNPTSEQMHYYYFTSPPKLKLNCSNTIFKIKDTFFIFNQFDKNSHNKTGRVLCPNVTVTFQLRTKKVHKYIAIRRTSYQKPFEWNTMAKLSVNNKYCGIWLSQKGSNTEKFSLKESDFLLDNKVDSISPGILNITLTTITYWRDISYSIIAL